MKSIPIDIPGKKGYLGLREDENATRIAFTDAAELEGFLIGEGILDGDNIGTGKVLNTVLTYDLYRTTRFQSQNGSDYILGFTSTGLVAYSTDDGATWSTVEVADNTTNLTFESGSPHVHLNFLTRGNIDVLVSNGIDTVYKIDGSIWPTSGKLRAFPLTTDSTTTGFVTGTASDIPPFLHGLFMFGRTIISDGERILMSAPDDMDRFYSTSRERTDGIYDDNQWVAPAAPGVSGYITGMFHTGQGSAFVTTSNGVFELKIETGQDGIPYLNIYTALIGAGCPSGAACVSKGRIYFESDYSGGSILALGRGAGGRTEGTPIELEAEAGWAVSEVAVGLRKSLAAVRASDFEHISVGQDTRTDYEQEDSSMRSGIDTATDPGWIWINAKTKLTFTVSVSASARGGFTGHQNLADNVYWDGTYADTRIYDDDPNWANSATSYSDSEKYGRIRFSLPIGWDTGSFVWGKPRIEGFGTVNGKTPELAESSLAWNHIYLDKIAESKQFLSIKFPFTFAEETTPGDGYVLLTFDFGALKNVSGIHVYDFNYYRANSGDIKIGEVYIEGTGTTSATYLTSIRKLTGLSASVNSEFGRMLFGFRAVDDTYYPKVQIRAGSTSGDTILTGTIDAITAGASTFVYDVSPTGTEADVQRGDKVVIESETKYVSSINTGTRTVTIYGTFASNHANDTAFNIYGSKSGASGNLWSDWWGSSYGTDVSDTTKSMTLAQLRRGFALNTLKERSDPTGTAITSSAAGYLWYQVKITLTLDLKSGLSPAVDWWRMNFYKGTLPLSNHLMAQGPDDTILLCAPSASSGSENDCTYVVDLLRGATKIAGQHIEAIVQNGKDFLVNTGRYIAKLWQGNYNYVYTTASADTALNRLWKSAKIVGQKLYLKRYFCNVLKYLGGNTTTGNVTAPAYASGGTSDGNNACPRDDNDIMAGYWHSNGKYYHVIPYGTTPNSQPSNLRLCEVNTTTGAVTEYVIETRGVAYAEVGWGLLPDDNEDIWIYYIAYAAADSTSPNRRLNRIKFTVGTSTMGTTENLVYQTTLSNVYNRLQCLRTADGLHHVFVGYQSATIRAIYHYYFEAGGTISALQTAKTATTATAYDFVAFLNRNGDPAVMYSQVATGGMYYKEYSGGAWGSEETITSSETAPGMCAISCQGQEYAFFPISGSGITFLLYIRKGGAWIQQETTFTPLASSKMASPSILNDGTILLALNAYPAAYYSVGVEDSWSTPAGISSVTSTYYVNLNKEIANKMLVSQTAGTGNVYPYTFYKVVQGSSTAGSNLTITAICDGVHRNVIYADNDLINSPEVIPASGNPGRTGMCNEIQFEIAASGRLQIGDQSAEIGRG